MKSPKKKPRAVCLVKDGLHYRRQCITHGVEVNGFDIVPVISDPNPNDLFVCWNRSFQGEQDADRFERGGARVIVIENGLLGKNFQGGNWFSLALRHVAGAGGSFPDGGPSRWDSFGIELQPWHDGAGETVILGQRGIGSRGINSPEKWAEKTQAKIGGRIRAHPGKYDPKIALVDDLAQASACITWASSSALQALMYGVPVFHEHPRWIGADAALPMSEFGKMPPRKDSAARLEMFRRAAWSMWRLKEIDNGTAFAHLLGDPK